MFIFVSSLPCLMDSLIQRQKTLDIFSLWIVSHLVNVVYQTKLFPLKWGVKVRNGNILSFYIFQLWSFPERRLPGQRGEPAGARCSGRGTSCSLLECSVCTSLQVLYTLLLLYKWKVLSLYEGYYYHCYYYCYYHCYIIHYNL